MEIQQLVTNFKQGNIRALGKAITIVENQLEGYDILLEELTYLTGKSQVIGFTGSPGAGKSSLIDSLVSFIRKNNLKVGVIAVDPSSPFTGGAILGDRIRMIQHSTDKGVFIRSMANRGQSGGLSIASKSAIKMLDAFGFDVIIVETVGTGQTEVDIIKTADTIVVVQNPEAGDDIQAIKAGIMEIADIFVINKADLHGANKAKINIEVAVRESTKKSDWEIPVIMTSSYKNEGIDLLWSMLRKHWEFLKASDELSSRRFKQIKDEINTLLDFKIKKYVDFKMGQPDFINLLKKAVDKEITTDTAVNEVFKRL